MTSWIQLNGPRRMTFDGCTVDAREVTLSDVASMLAKVNRFGGATRVPYSVAQHSVFVADLVAERGGSRAAQLKALFHDAHEFCTGDMLSPVIWELPPSVAAGLAVLKASIDAALEIRFGIFATSTEDDKLIKNCDKLAAAVEARDLLPGGPLDDWHLNYAGELPARTVIPIDWESARDIFIERFRLLDESRA